MSPTFSEKAIGAIGVEIKFFKKVFFVTSQPFEEKDSGSFYIPSMFSSSKDIQRHPYCEGFDNLSQFCLLKFKNCQIPNTS
jgi:hypothetical protein